MQCYFIFTYFFQLTIFTVNLYYFNCSTLLNYSLGSCYFFYIYIMLYYCYQYFHYYLNILEYNFFWHQFQITIIIITIINLKASHTDCYKYILNSKFKICFLILISINHFIIISIFLLTSLILMFYCSKSIFVYYDKIFELYPCSSIYPPLQLISHLLNFTQLST